MVGVMANPETKQAMAPVVGSGGVLASTKGVEWGVNNQSSSLVFLLIVVMIRKVGVL
jgi:hypothetical protein